VAGPVALAVLNLVGLLVGKAVDRVLLQPKLGANNPPQPGPPPLLVVLLKMAVVVVAVVTMMVAKMVAVP